MIRKFTLAAAALTLSALALTAAPSAVAKGHVYKAVPVTAMAGKEIAIDDVLWSCTADGCTNATANGSATRICALVVKKIGKLESFHVDSEALAADKLASCNENAA